MLMGGLPPGMLRDAKAPSEPADFAIFVSPEYFIEETKVRQGRGERVCSEDEHHAI